MNGKMLRIFRLAIAGMIIGLGATAQAANLYVSGSPTWDQATNTGFKNSEVPFAPGWSVSNIGTAVGYTEKYVNGSDKGSRAVRWDASGTSTELGNLGTDNNGCTAVGVFALNSVGTAVGGLFLYVNGYQEGSCAVRWDASSTSPVRLANPSSGGYDSEALAISDSGVAVGFVVDMGSQPVRWNASGTVGTELDVLWTNDGGMADSEAYAVNNAGTAVGYAVKFVSDANNVGVRAVRWDASGTTATELGNLGTDANGVTYSRAYAVNDAGTAVGYAEKHVNGVSLGLRAVRWNASSATAIELQTVGPSYATSKAFAVNASGTAVGSSGNYAVRWDGSGTTATVLQGLSGSSVSNAYALNNAGTTVGYSQRLVNGTYVNQAVIWQPSGSVIDLNDLGVVPVPAGGTWTLTTAKALSADGWVSGEGTFDPDGGGPLAGYTRLWVAQVGLGGTWKNVTGGTWGRGPNWTTGTPATQVGYAQFTMPSTYTVTLDRDECTRTISVDFGIVTFDCNGHTLTSESGLNIANGATLKGTGTIISDITNAGIIAPGNSPGMLNINGSLTNNNKLEFEIANLSSHDKINVTGAFISGGTIALKLSGGYVPADGDIFNLMSFDSFADSGYVFDFSQAGLPADLQWDTATFATTGSISVVPEPCTLVLLGVAGLGLLICVWRGRNQLRG